MKAENARDMRSVVESEATYGTIAITKIARKTSGAQLAQLGSIRANQSPKKRLPRRPARAIQKITLTSHRRASILPSAFGPIQRGDPFVSHRRPRNIR